MVTFKELIRNKRPNGFYPVYIHIVYRSRMGYIKTDKVVTKYIDRMRELGLERNAKNYRLAVNHLERFVDSNKIMFSFLTSTVLNGWVESLAASNRAKEMYPTCVRQISKKELMELNDEERDIILIKFNSWIKVQIPKSDSTVKRAISAEAYREFSSCPLPKSKMVSPVPEQGRDVALLSLCLGGINTADLYDLKKADYKDGIISYKRAKHATVARTKPIWK